MEQNSTSKPVTEPGTGDNSDGEVGPLSILPICVSLFAVVAITIAAVVFYRKRQRQRAQLLARQLRVTERRIDVVGSIRGKREERKSLYRPPTDVRASASEPSIVTRPISGIRPHYVIRACQLQPRNQPLSSARSAVNSSACSCDYGESTFCSTCKEEDKRNAKESKIDASAGSLAVELATVPSVSSMSTIRSTTIRKTQSETAAGVHLEGFRHISSMKSSMASIPGKDDTSTPSKHILEWMEKATTAKAPTTTIEDVTMTDTSEQKPPPNTPASHSLATSASVDTGRAVEKTLSYVSESAQSEEWV